MKSFASLCRNLDETTRTNIKIELLSDYFNSVPPEDSIWAVSFLIGRKPRQIIPTRKLIEWSAETAAIPGWLFSECHEAVGDLAETIALLLPSSGVSSVLPLHVLVEEKLLVLRNKSEEKQKAEILSAWEGMNKYEKFVYNKLITGEFRIGVSARLVTKALSGYSGIDEQVIAHRLMGSWRPTEKFFRQLVSADTKDSDISRPYPFFLAYQLDDQPENLGGINEWFAEWKWDGIRSQLIKRNGEVFIWSRGEDMLNEKFPELTELGFLIPDGTVIDGEIMGWRNGKPLPFGDLQKRIGRKNVTRKIMEEVPAALIAYDVLEYNNADIREYSLTWRRKILNELIDNISDNRLLVSPEVPAESWEDVREARENARSRSVEGLMLKRLDSSYKSGRRRGDWWKWKTDPLTADAVLIYAQPGHGRRANLYTDYTFGIWDSNELVPFAKAYSGLTDEEIRKVDSFVRHNTIQKFGPVRTVKPELVFELAFEAIQESSRHRSGVAVRFPRILRWRHDKSIKDADTIETIKSLFAK